MLTQSKYIQDIILDLKMTEAKTRNTLLPVGIKFTTASEHTLPQPAAYRRLIGMLLYLGFTRPDISHATQQLSQFLQTPCKKHWDVALHVVRYLKSTPRKCIFFPSDAAPDLSVYCDSDWASCLDSRRSLTRYFVFLGTSLISWKTKMQNTISSTAEAEHIAMGSTTCELVWISFLL